MSELPGPSVIEARQMLQRYLADRIIFVNYGEKTSDTTGIFHFKIPEDIAVGESHFDGLIHREGTQLIFTADRTLSEGHMIKSSGLPEFIPANVEIGALVRAYGAEVLNKRSENSRWALAGFKSAKFPGIALPDRNYLVDFSNSDDRITDATLTDLEGKVIATIEGMTVRPVTDIGPFLAEHVYLEIVPQCIGALSAGPRDGERDGFLYLEVGETTIGYTMSAGDDLQIEAEITLQKGLTRRGGNGVIKHGILEMARVAGVVGRRARPRSLGEASGS